MHELMALTQVNDRWKTVIFSACLNIKFKDLTNAKGAIMFTNFISKLRKYISKTEQNISQLLWYTLKIGDLISGRGTGFNFQRLNEIYDSYWSIV